VRSWGRIARRLELGERVLRRLGCFGARESYYPVLLELASPRSGKPYSRVRPLHRPPAGRKEPPNPVPETHREHLRRQALEPCRPCAATTPRATPPACDRTLRRGRRVWTRGSVHLVVASAAASLAGCAARRSSSAALTSSGCADANVAGVVLDRDELHVLGRPKSCTGKQGKRTAVTHTHWTFGSATLSV
jgi:hypothetical protein